MNSKSLIFDFNFYNKCLLCIKQERSGNILNVDIAKVDMYIIIIIKIGNVSMNTLLFIYIFYYFMYLCI